MPCQRRHHLRLHGEIGLGDNTTIRLALSLNPGKAGQ
jgi:hypothetical protein